MINIANNSLVNTQNKFTLSSEKMATLEDSGTRFGCFNLVLILESLQDFLGNLRIKP